MSRIVPPRIISFLILTRGGPSFDQDAWFSYARLEEDAYRAAREDGEQLNPDKVRDVYERGVAQVPPGSEKRLWRRYIFLWLFYATFEEIETKVCLRSLGSFVPPDVLGSLTIACSSTYKGLHSCSSSVQGCSATRTASILHLCQGEPVGSRFCIEARYRSDSISLSFPLNQLWIQYAYFELRQKDVEAAKKIMGTAIGMCPKEKLFKAYIELRMKASWMHLFSGSFIARVWQNANQSYPDFSFSCSSSTMCARFT